jgi:hypothetical protein
MAAPREQLKTESRPAKAAGRDSVASPTAGPIPGLRLLLAVALAMVTMLVISACAGSAPVEEPQALLDIQSGKVEVLGFRQTEFVGGFTDQELHPGDRIRVGEDAQAAVIFFDGSVAMLDAGSDIVVEKLLGSRETGKTDIQFFQVAGNTMNRVAKVVDADSSYGVRTSSSVGLVRGTVFKVGIDEETGETEWKSLEGRVGVGGASQVEVIVEPGEKTVVQRGEDPAPPVVDPPSVEELVIVEEIEALVEGRAITPPERKDPEKIDEDEATPAAPQPTPTLPPLDLTPEMLAQAEVPATLPAGESGATDTGFVEPTATPQPTSTPPPTSTPASVAEAGGPAEPTPTPVPTATPVSAGAATATPRPTATPVLSPLP